MEKTLTENKNKICSVDKCNKIICAKKLCNAHYLKYKKYGDALIGKDRERHGMHGTKEYRAWFHIKNRCLNPKTKGYHRYGGRGITICKRWENSFTNFYEDMGKSPNINYQIDRIDNEGNYIKENCRWISRVENMRNNSQTKITMEDAEEIRRIYISRSLTMADIGRKFNISHSNVSAIINNKIWKIEKHELIKQDADSRSVDVRYKP